MAKPLVERYTQILSEDPTSTVFVELAKALLAQSEWDRAIEVCRAGLDHHPQSVIARVLWGRALIHLGKPAPAMEQFDLAISIDRENPHAYNLISEVLLQKGLYRSALPILRKAVALQPHDARVKGWFEQTQAVLKGGPAPQIAPSDALVPAEVPEEAAAQSPDDPFAALASVAPRDDEEPHDEPTVLVRMQSQVATPAGGIPRLYPQGEAPIDSSLHPTERNEILRAPVPGAGLVSASWEVGPQDRPVAGRDEVRDEDERTQLTLASPGAQPAGGFTGEDGDVDLDDPSGDDDLQGSFAQDGADGDDIAALPVLTLAAADQAQEDAATSGGLLGELPELEDASGSFSLAPARSPSLPELRMPAAGQGHGGLLDELPLPAEEEPAPTRARSKGQVSTQVSAAIASEYEKELRAKLERSKAERGARMRKLVMGAVAVLVIGVLGTFAWAFLRTREDFGGKDLKGALAEASRLVGQDTRASIQSALATLSAATRMDDESTEAWSQVALAQAFLVSDHGGGDAARAAAREALAREGVVAAHPGTQLVVNWLLTGGAERNLAGDVVLAAGGDDAELHSLAGRILLSRGQSKAALERFQQAVKHAPTHGRTLLALGAYYRESGDAEQALEMYARVDAPHPEKVIGEAEVRLTMGRPEAGDRAALEALPAEELRTPELKARHAVTLARVLSDEGKHAEALAAAEKALAIPVREVQTLIALSEVQRAAGHTARAQVSAEKALKLDPQSDAAHEALGRALLARGQPRELLSELEADAKNRTVSLLRGLARAQLGEWKSARTELARTGLDGGFPPEAVVALAMADAAEGKPAKAQEVLEKILVGGDKVPDSIRVALGRVYWQRGLLAKARAQFEEAAERPRDFEGHLQLGRLLLEQDQYAEALAPLQTAVARNGGSTEGRGALAQALLGLGKLTEARTLLDAWVKDDPRSGPAHRWLARAQLLAGEGKEAVKSAAKAVKFEPEDAVAFKVQAVALATAGEASEAFRALQRANKLDSKDPEIFCEIGWTFRRQGVEENATAAFDAALRGDANSVCGRVGKILVDPKAHRAEAKELGEYAEKAGNIWDRAAWLTALSRLQLAAGSPKTAVKTAEQAVGVIPTLPMAHEALALAAEKTRDGARATAAWDRAAALDPANALLRLALADALSGEKDQLERAVKEYEAFLELPAPESDTKRVEKLLPKLRKRLASR